MNPLIVYYSRTGNTKNVAEMIAHLLDCEIAPIIDTVNRSGLLGFLRSGWSAKRGTMTEIEAMTYDPSTYDVVIVGTPVWAGTVSTPVRTFLHQYKDRLPSVALFATHKSEDAQDAFTEMKKECEKKPVALLGLGEKEIKKDQCSYKVREFVDTLENEMHVEI